MHVRSGLESREENLAKEKAEAAVDGMQEEQNIIIPKKSVVLKVLRSGRRRDSWNIHNLCHFRAKAIC